MKFCSIASGSSGNCLYIGSENTHLLVDAGISGKRIEKGLLDIKEDASNLQGILITHEHSDHIQGVGVLARRYHIPIYGTVETINAMLRQNNIGKIDESLLHFVSADFEFEVGDLLISPYQISHDASNPICYTCSCNGRKIGMATDLGKYDAYVMSRLKDSDLLYIEANHDVNMLLVGGYPYHLKQRILGDLGHLSNELSANLICELLHDRLKHIYLGHLSKENNYAELAYETVKVELEKEIASSDKMPQLKVANRDCISDIVYI